LRCAAYEGDDVELIADVEQALMSLSGDDDETT
jgi:hypothetical protein